MMHYIAKYDQILKIINSHIINTQYFIAAVHLYKPSPWFNFLIPNPESNLSLQCEFWP